MPLLAIIDGMRVTVYFKDHLPPHIHVALAEYRAKIDIETLTVFKGGLPLAQERKVIEWARNRREKLLAAWVECQDGQSPGRIR